MAGRALGTGTIRNGHEMKTSEVIENIDYDFLLIDLPLQNHENVNFVFDKISF